MFRIPIATKWNPHFDDKPTSNIPRIKISEKFSRSYLQERNIILEIGCGTGSYINLIDRIGCLGLDLDMGALRIAKKYCKSSEFIAASALNLPFKKDAIDLVCVWGMFEEIPNSTEERVVEEIHRVLETKGVFLLSVYNDKIVTKILDPAFIFRGIRHYNLKSLMGLFSKYDFVVNDCIIRGGMYSLIANFLVYFYKHLMRKKEGVIKNFFDAKSTEELVSERDGMVYFFIASTKSGVHDELEG